jgi:hypothetical protein
MSDFLLKVRVVLTAAPTWITAAATLVTIFSEEIGGLLPAGAAESLASAGAIVLAWLGAAINIIRRVTPVLPEERGILPQG